ncbi:MAG TPA: protein kinase [Negativicutes bacterium]|nr:protein kinase [Negativicutes bacterium]
MAVPLFDREIRYSPGQCIGGFRILKPAGEGKYGICYLVTDNENLYILKQLKKRMLRAESPKAQCEEKILKILEHEAIPRFAGRLETSQFTGYMLEYKEGATLEDMIFKQGYVFGRGEIYSIGKQLIGIMDYLHQRGIVHMDIRVPNVIFDGSRVYLVDFGSAGWIDNVRYKADMDFSYFGDLLLHLYYTSFSDKPRKSRPWYEELDLSTGELYFLKRLMGLEERYETMGELKADFEGVFKCRLNA